MCCPVASMVGSESKPGQMDDRHIVCLSLILIFSNDLSRTYDGLGAYRDDRYIIQHYQKRGEKTHKGEHHKLDFILNCCMYFRHLRGSAVDLRALQTETTHIPAIKRFDMYRTLYQDLNTNYTVGVVWWSELCCDPDTSAT